MDDFLKSILPTLSSAGVAGVVLWYLLTRIVPTVQAFQKDMWAEMGKQREELRRLEEAMDRATKADLIRLIASPHVSDALKEGATNIIREVEDAAAARKAVAAIPPVTPLPERST